jgi:protein-tyrosine phosphatase
MAEHGVDIQAHRAQQLTAELVKQHELILVMEQWQQKEIEHLYPYARGRVHLLGKWGVGDIADPYKKPREAFVDAYAKIERSCNEWCKKVW